MTRKKKKRKKGSHNMKNVILYGTLIVLFTVPGHSEVEVLSTGESGFEDVVNDGMVSDASIGKNYSLRYRFFCFGHNLRGKQAVNVASDNANMVKYRPEHDGDK